MITTIIFDLSEVQLQGFVGVEKYLEPVLNMKAEEIEPRLQGPEFIKLLEGKITEDEYWQKMLDKNNWSVDIKKFKEAVRNNFKEIKGTKEIIKQLKEKGFKLGLLSDHAKEWIGYINKKFDYHELFDSKLYSFEVKTTKLNKDIFGMIIKKLNERPSNCLFIDDNPINIKTAEKLGIKVINFVNPQQLKKDLISLDIIID